MNLPTENYEKVSKEALRHRIRRKRQSTRKKKVENINIDNIIAIGFDGRDDDTIVPTEVQTSQSKKIRYETQKKHHITVVAYPGGERLGHFQCDKKGKDISDGLIKFCEERNLKLDEIYILLCDGCATNTGRHKRVITCMEIHLGRPLLLDSCLLHAIEKPLHHLIEHLDGPTDGPNSWSGPIGKKITGNVQNLPIAKFKIINNPNFPHCPPEVINKLNTDQRYMYKICKVIITGVVPEGFGDQRPGNMCHSRWLTTAARICRVYLSEENPTEKHQRLVSYIIFVYMPSWLNVHWHSNIRYASSHLLQEIKRVNDNCNEEEKNVVLPIIQVNGFAGTPEMVILCMLMSDDRNLREEAIMKIVELRKKSPPKLRKRLANKINFNATEINNICSLEDTTEPPITMKLSIEEIQSYETHPFELNVPCHTQSVERNVKLTTECAGAVAGAQNQDGYAFNVIAARKAIP